MPDMALQACSLQRTGTAWESRRFAVRHSVAIVDVRPAEFIVLSTTGNTRVRGSFTL
jgi:hypothetical protein